MRPRRVIQTTDFPDMLLELYLRCAYYYCAHFEREESPPLFSGEQHADIVALESLFDWFCHARGLSTECALTDDQMDSFWTFRKCALGPLRPTTEVVRCQMVDDDERYS